MQKPHVTVASWLLSFLLAFTPYHGHSKSFPKEQGLDKKTYLLREQILNEYSQIKNASQFVKFFAHGRSGAEKAEITERLLRLDKLPAMTRSKNGFRFSANGSSLTVEIISLGEHRFLVNGLEYTLNPQLNLIEQADEMGRLLRDANPKKYSHMMLLLPEAHAIAPVIVAALTVLSTTILGVFATRYGTAALEVLEWEICDRIKPNLNDPDRNPYWCKGYLEEKQKKMNPQDSAVKHALSTTSKDGEIFSTLAEKCPFETQGKYYHGDIRILKDPTSETKGKDSQLSILAEFTDGKIKHIKVYQTHYDNVEGNLKQSLMATYEVDASSVLKTIVLPNNIKIASNADLKDDPVMLAEQTVHRKIFSYIGDRLTICKVKQQELEAKKIDKAAGKEDKNKSDRKASVGRP